MKILIIGHAGRGKTTLAQRLGTLLHIPTYSIDDYIWKIRFTHKRDPEETMQLLEEIYQTDDWIVEGASRTFTLPYMERADLIIHLIHPNIIQQFWILFVRYRSRKYERIWDLLDLYWSQLKKRFSVKSQNQQALEKLLSFHNDKVINVRSFKEIDDVIERLASQHATKENLEVADFR